MSVRRSVVQTCAALLCLLVAGYLALTQVQSLKARSNIRLVATVSENPVPAGQRLRYTLTLGNAGPADAHHVRVTGTVPRAVTGAIATAGRGTTCELTGHQLSCSRERLAAGELSVITITGRVDAGAGPGVLTALASARADAPRDRIASDNTVILPITVVSRPARESRPARTIRAG